LPVLDIIGQLFYLFVSLNILVNLHIYFGRIVSRNPLLDIYELESLPSFFSSEKLFIILLFIEQNIITISFHKLLLLSDPTILLSQEVA